MIYNDAYSEFQGDRHPALLGSRVRAGWPEVAAFNDNVMNVVLAGKCLAYRDQGLSACPLWVARTCMAQPGLFARPRRRWPPYWRHGHRRRDVKRSPRHAAIA